MSFDNIEFIGWDCEGINDGWIDPYTERQKLVLISASTGDYLYNESGIPQEQRLEFISDIAARYRSDRYKHVFFGGSYDFNKILEGLTLEKLKELHEAKHWTLWNREWLLRYRPRKELTIARLQKGVSFNYKQQAKQQCRSYIRFWDVIGFFQDSFLNVVKKWLGEDYPDYELIAAGKHARLSFKGDDKQFMIEYNKAETIALVEVMKKLHTQLTKLDLKVSRWDGAGAVAGQIFRRYRLTDSYFESLGKNRKTKILLDISINDACQYAYFGGRIESGFIGRYQGTVYNYDINSAYPFAASFLPNLNFGKWIHHSRQLSETEILSMDEMSIFRVQWYFHQKRIYYPFPFRTLNGAVIFPQSGERWIMRPELVSAIRSLSKHDKLYVWEGYEFKRDSAPAPFSVLSSLYYERQKLIAANDPAEYPLKLGLNSIYGKLCQKLGWNEETKQSPAFHFLLFAAWITSFVRAKIYDVVQLAQNDVIAINTDGIVSTQPLSIRHSDKKEFGGWSLEISDEIIQLQSGVYWILKGEQWKERARGLGRVVGEGETEIDRKESRNEKIKKRIAAILDGWDAGEKKVHFPVKLFITSKKSTISDDWFKRWGHWYVMHDSKTGELGRSLELQCSGWGKRRLDSRLSSKRLTATVAAENIEWNGKLGSNDPSLRDLGEPYNLPWINPAEESHDLDDDGDLEIL